MKTAPSSGAPMVDGFQRTIRYLRLSVTDRCDLRCTYCMPERMNFLPKSDVLSYDELATLADMFIDRGVTKIRITGGEPLVRKDIMVLFERLATRLSPLGSLKELTLTTNGVHLDKYASQLAELGVRRVNVSLDTLDPQRFELLTRRAAMDKVLAGIEAAQAAGLKVKLNTVAMANVNREEIPQLVKWAHERDCDISLIEVMPMGETPQERASSFLPLSTVRKDLEERWTLEDIDFSTGGPSRYMTVKDTGGRLGFISPLSHNFCSSCNRVRLTCTGRLYSCLGREDGADLREALRNGADLDKVESLIDQAVNAKPERHDFDVDRLDSPASPRNMSVTGG